jgi:hypothetical protein
MLRRTQEFCWGGGGVQQIQLWAEGREGFRSIIKWVKPVLLGCYQYIFHETWEVGSALSKLRILGEEGLKSPPPGTPLL